MQYTVRHQVDGFVWRSRSRARSKETEWPFKLCHPASLLICISSCAWFDNTGLGLNWWRKLRRLTRGTMVGRPCAHCTQGIVNKNTWMWLRFQRCRMYPVPSRVGIPKTWPYTLYYNHRFEASNCATVVQSVSFRRSVPFGYTLEISIIHLEFWLGVGCLGYKPFQVW